MLGGAATVVFDHVSKRYDPDRAASDRPGAVTDLSLRGPVAAQSKDPDMDLIALVAGGGLGRYIVDGFALQDTAQLVAGGILLAVLAIGAERLLSSLESWLTSPGLRTLASGTTVP